MRSNAWVHVAPDSSSASFPDPTQPKGFLEMAADPTVALLIGGWRSVLVEAGTRTLGAILLHIPHSLPAYTQRTS